jgi:hypothetical protein
LQTIKLKQFHSRVKRDTTDKEIRSEEPGLDSKVQVLHVEIHNCFTACVIGFSSSTPAPFHLFPVLFSSFNFPPICLRPDAGLTQLLLSQHFTRQVSPPLYLLKALQGPLHFSFCPWKEAWTNWKRSDLDVCLYPVCAIGEKCFACLFLENKEFLVTTYILKSQVFSVFVEGSP